MVRDARWEMVWAEVRPWTEHAGWVQFSVEVAPDAVSEWTAMHQDDLAMDPMVFAGMLAQMVRELDARLGDAPASSVTDRA